MFVFPGVMAALFLAPAVPPSWAQDVEGKARIEINATDGDAGFHIFGDGDPWRKVEIKNPTGRVIQEIEAEGVLRRQGETEFFKESAEPSCEDQPLAKFLKRFREGTYKFKFTMLTGERQQAEYELTHALPAAPINLAAIVNSSLVIQWMPGTDLGNCHDDEVQALIDEGIIPNPEGVGVDYWEVTVEPDEDLLAEKGLPRRVFTIQVPANQLSVTVPPEYWQPYVTDGVNVFKFEVGGNGLGENENQTFSERTFTIE
jgi:hypothetical protein